MRWPPDGSVRSTTRREVHLGEDLEALAALHPDIAFFAERNPRHGEGEELVCLVEIRWWDLFLALGRSVSGQLRGWARRGLRNAGVRVGT